MNIISLADASQNFPELLEKVEQGEGFVIRHNGETVATLMPPGVQANEWELRGFKDKKDDPQWQAAYRRMVARMKKGARLGGLRIDREEFYGRDDEKIVV